MKRSTILVNRIYLTVILCSVGMVLVFNLANYFWGPVSFGIVTNLILNQAVILLPAMLYFPASKTRIRQMIPFRKIKVSSVFIIILFTYLTLPFVSVINALSLLFTDSAAMQLQGQLASVPPPVAFLIVAFVAPFCEEFVFRGIFYHGLKDSGRYIGAVLLSAVMFAMIHMNLNQMAYTVVLGAIFCLLVEATGSIWAPVIAHMTINGNSLMLMSLGEALLQEYNDMEGAAEMMEAVSAGNALYSGIGRTIGVITALISVCGMTALAVCVYAWLCRNENRKEHVRSLFVKQKVWLVTPAFLAAAVVCILYMMI